MTDYKCKIIDDRPKDHVDETHNNIAKAIVETYGNYNKVALYGSWGVGKSSVVKKVAKKMEAIEILFDFWYLSKDQIRRDFLKTLISHVERKNGKSVFIKWNNYEIEAKKIVDGSYQEITTKNRPENLTDSQKKATIMLLSFVTFMALLTFNEKIQSFIDMPVILNLIKDANNWIIGILVFIILKVMWTVIFNCFPDIAELVSRKINMESRSDVTQSNSTNGDLSGVDFKKIYDQVAQVIAKDEKRYLICLDNLDRMDNKRVRIMLDEVSIFFDAEPNQYIKFIIPLDRVILDNTLDYHSNKDLKQDTTKDLDTYENSRFIEKLFNVYFDMPNMINFDWYAILKNNIREAFGQTDDKLGDSVVNIFYDTMKTPISVKTDNVSSNNQVKPPVAEDKNTTTANDKANKLTPRDIIYFVNAMVTTYLTIKHLNIELEDIALYVGIKQFNSKKELDDYFSKTYDNNNYLRWIKSEISIMDINSITEHADIVRYFNNYNSIYNLYKVHYQTDNPIETLYKKEIINAIETRNIDSLNKILDGKTAEFKRDFLRHAIVDYKGKRSYNDLYFYQKVYEILGINLLKELEQGFINVYKQEHYGQFGYYGAKPNNEEMIEHVEFVQAHIEELPELNKEFDGNFTHGFYLRELENTYSYRIEPWHIKGIELIYNKIENKIVIYDLLRGKIETILNNPNRDYVVSNILIFGECLYFLQKYGQVLLDVYEYYNACPLNYLGQNPEDTNFNYGLKLFLEDKDSSYDMFIRIILTLDIKNTTKPTTLQADIDKLALEKKDIILNYLSQFSEEEQKLFSVNIKHITLSI